MSVRGFAVLAAAAVAGVASVMIFWQPSDLTGAGIPEPGSSPTVMDIPAVKRLLPGARVPADVGAGWSVVSWSPTSADTPGLGVDRPAQLLLVSPTGTRHPLAEISGLATVRDASTDGRRVLLATPDGDPSAATRERLTVLDLDTGRTVPFLAQGFLTSARLVGRAGEEVLLTYSDGDTYWGELLDREGRRAIAFPNVSEERSAMLSDLDGRLALRGTGEGMSLLDLHTGSVIRTLAPPLGRTACEPERWWSTGIVLASCRSTGGTSGEVWQFPISGATPTSLGQGWRAWPFSGGILIWNGLGYEVARADGTRTAQDWRPPSTIGGHERDVIAVVAGSAYALARACDGSCEPMSLIRYDLETDQVRAIIGPRAGEGNVNSAAVIDPAH